MVQVPKKLKRLQVQLRPRGGGPSAAPSAVRKPHRDNSTSHLRLAHADRHVLLDSVEEVVLAPAVLHPEPALAVASPRLESTASPPGTFAALVALADRQVREDHLPSAFVVRVTVADPLRVGSEEVDLVQIGIVLWVLEVELRVVEFALGVHLRAGRRPIVRP